MRVCNMHAVVELLNYGKYQRSVKLRKTKSFSRYYTYHYSTIYSNGFDMFAVSKVSVSKNILSLSLANRWKEIRLES